MCAKDVCFIPQYHGGKDRSGMHVSGGRKGRELSGNTHPEQAGDRVFLQDASIVYVDGCVFLLIITLHSALPWYDI